MRTYRLCKIALVSFTVLFGIALGSARAELQGQWSGQPKGKCKDTTEGIVCAGKGKVVITNTGASSSVPTTVTFYLSATCTVQPGALQIGTATLKALKPGKSGKANMKASLPAGVDPEGMYIVAVIGPAEDGRTACVGPIGDED